MKEQTIYSYKLMRRLRWGLFAGLSQIILLLAVLYMTAVWQTIPLARLLVATSIIVLVPIQHLLLFRLYAFFRSQSPKLSPDMLFSAWWGASTAYPLPLSVFCGGELTVVLGSLLIAAAAYVWLPFHYGITLLAGTLVLAFPRCFALWISLRQPKHCQVKYETASIAFLVTDG